jgi:hypothetical protein
MEPFVRSRCRKDDTRAPSNGDLEHGGITMRRRSLAIPIALLAGMNLTVGAVAGGWATVSVTDAPVDPPAGGGTVVELDVLQHGQTAISWLSLTVIATNDGTGESFRTPAEAKGPTGRYVATLTFPTEGRWTLTFDSPDLIMEGSATMQVAAAVAPVASVAPAPLTSAVPATDPAALGLAALIILVGVVGGALAIRGRRAGPRDERASVSG